jgi:hypothetical protein
MRLVHHNIMKLAGQFKHTNILLGTDEGRRYEVKMMASTGRDKLCSCTKHEYYLTLGIGTKSVMKTESMIQKAPRTGRKIIQYVTDEDFSFPATNRYLRYTCVRLLCLV